MQGTALPRKHHHGQLREAVLREALSRADQGSLEALSIRELSRGLGVSAAAVYRHFADRDAVLEATALAGFNQLAERFELALPFASHARSAPQARARFVALGQAYVAFAQDSYGLWRLMFGPLGPARLPDAPNCAPTTYDWLGKSLHELHAQGLIAPPDPFKQRFVWTSIHGLSDLLASPALGRAAPSDPQVEAHCDLLLRALA